MAEKEERYISITQMVAKENIETEKYRVMPRQEAIKRIENAIYVEHNSKTAAEAALDALLK